MNFKVLNGTPNHSTPSLCFSCGNGQVIQGQRASNFTVRCSAAPMGNGFIVTEPVVSCTEYFKRFDQSLREMKEIAHILVTKKGRVVGFFNPLAAAEKIKLGEGDKVNPETREVRDPDEY